MKKQVFLALLLFFLAIAVMGQEKVKCKGTTAKGTPCQLASSKQHNDGYCRFHSPNKIVCGHKLSSEKVCQNPVKEEGTKCHLHRDIDHEHNTLLKHEK